MVAYVQTMVGYVQTMVDYLRVTVGLCKPTVRGYVQCTQLRNGRLYRKIVNCTSVNSQLIP